MLRSANQGVSFWHRHDGEYVSLLTGLDPNGSVDATDFINREAENLAAEFGSNIGGGSLVIPRGEFLVGTIFLPHHVELVGSGVGTVLRARPNIGGPVITNADPGDRFVAVRNLRINGNKAVQSTGSSRYGILFDTQDVPGDEYADGHWTIENVLITDTKDDGIRLIGRGEGIVSKVRIRDADGYGLYLSAADCDLDQVMVGTAGLAGFYISGANERLSNCKAFYCGKIDPAQGDGFFIEGAGYIKAVTVEAQDNQRHGFHVKNSSRVDIDGQADSNNAGHDGAPDQSGAGFKLDNATSGIFVGTSRSRGVNTREQKWGVSISNGIAGSTIDIKSSGNSSGNIEGGISSESDIAINGYRGRQSIAYAASITPNPTNGQTIIVGTLTGPITVNAPATDNRWSGQRMSFKFTQDGTGGRVITFAASYKLNWTPNTAAGKINTIDFIYDGTDWVQFPGINI